MAAMLVQRDLPFISSYQTDTRLDSFVVSNATVSGLRKGIPTGRVSHGDRGNPNLYVDQPIPELWCQPIRGHGS